MRVSAFFFYAGISCVENVRPQRMATTAICSHTSIIELQTSRPPQTMDGSLQHREGSSTTPLPTIRKRPVSLRALMAIVETLIPRARVRSVQQLEEQKLLPEPSPPLHDHVGFFTRRISSMAPSDERIAPERNEKVSKKVNLHQIPIFTCYY